MNNRWGLFWANVPTSTELDATAYSAGFHCYVIMPEATSRISEIRALYPNAYIEMRHSTPSWPGTDPKEWARSVKKFYDTHGSQVNGWAFLNEPDIEPGWPGYGQPIKDQVWAAAQWARECAMELKRICPGIRLHAPAMAFEDRGYGWPWFMETWKPVYELCEVVNSHNYWEEGGNYYRDGLYHEKHNIHHAFRYWQLRDWMLHYKISRPIFIEECGNFAPNRPDYWQDLSYYFKKLEEDAAFIIGGCVFILKSNKPNWVNDLTRQPDIRQFFRSLREQEKRLLPFPDLIDPRPKIRIAKRLSWQISNSPIIGYEELPLEEYLKDVVPRELPKRIKDFQFDTPLEAFKAQAIAARSYAVYAMKHPRHGDKAHVCNSTHCQVWAGGARHELSDRAIRETEGVVAKYKNEPINAFYSANCGGSTINSEDIWPQAVPYCRAVSCPIKTQPVSGHRVGLCQYGATRMAIGGKVAKEILKHYYTGITVNLPDPSPPPPLPPPLPPPPPPTPEKKLMILETRIGSPIIVGDLGSSNIQLCLNYWGNIATARSGEKPEHGQGGFELRGWPAADTLFEVEILGKKYPVPVSKSRPWTKVGWDEVLPEPEPPKPPPGPEPEPEPGPGPYPDEGLYKPPVPFGIHAGRGCGPNGLERDLADMADLGLGIVVIVSGDELQLERAAKYFWRSGVLPIMRPYCLIDGRHDFARDVRILLQYDIPPYIQIYNEPNDDREWKSGRPNYQVFVPRWVDAAEAVVNAGGWPGLQVLDTQLLRVIIAETMRRGCMDIWERAWFSAHNYGLNHPPGYPYDDVNQLGVPVPYAPSEPIKFTAPIEMVNRWRESDKNPGQTIHDDYNGVLGFLAFAKVFEEELGFVPPMICSEGGWQYGNSQDRRYPIIDKYLHGKYHAGMYAWFKTKQLPNGISFPSYLWAICPWILSGPDADAWVGGALGTKEFTIQEVKKITLGG